MGRRGGVACWLLNRIDTTLPTEPGIAVNLTVRRLVRQGEQPFVAACTAYSRLYMMEEAAKTLDRGAFLLRYNELRRFAAVAWNNLLVSSRI